jgi:hypothetical protein
VSLNVELSLLPEPSSAVKSFKVPGDILHIDFHPSGAHFAVTCTITLRDEAFFFRRSTETGEWEQRLDIGLGGSLGNVNSEEVCHDSIYIRMPAECSADLRSTRYASPNPARFCVQSRTMEALPLGPILWARSPARRHHQQAFRL